MQGTKVLCVSKRKKTHKKVDSNCLLGKNTKSFISSNRDSRILVIEYETAVLSLKQLLQSQESVLRSKTDSLIFPTIYNSRNEKGAVC